MRKVRNTSPLFHIGVPRYAAAVHTEPRKTDAGRRNWRT